VDPIGSLCKLGYQQSSYLLKRKKRVLDLEKAMNKPDFTVLAVQREIE
jgi:hypothetical protein